MHGHAFPHVCYPNKEEQTLEVTLLTLKYLISPKKNTSIILVLLVWPYRNASITFSVTRIKGGDPMQQSAHLILSLTSFPLIMPLLYLKTCFVTVISHWTTLVTNWFKINGRLHSRVVSVHCSNALLCLLVVRPRKSFRLPCSQLVKTLTQHALQTGMCVYCHKVTWGPHVWQHMWRKRQTASSEVAEKV